VTGILGENDRGTPQHLDRPKRKIPHVADGGADDEEASGRSVRVHATFQGIRSKSPAD
jgi:hypothetical protein